MNIERDSEKVRRAVAILRKRQAGVGRRHSRIHKNAAMDNTHRLRAIDEGICSRCSNLHLEFPQLFGRPSIEVKCLRGYSPLEIYRRLELGKTPECPGLDNKPK